MTAIVPHEGGPGGRPAFGNDLHLRLRFGRILSVLGLELIVVVGAALVACRLGAQRTGIASPALLLAAGVLLGFIPAFTGIELPSAVVLLLFLPALLWWEALNTPLREVHKFRRSILLTGTLLVVITAGAVAATAHAFGLPWGPAWVLGAALAPTDATAVSVVRRLLPRRELIVLRAESLINDGTALVVFGIAVSVVVGEQDLSVLTVGWELFVSYAGGIAAGVIAAVLGVYLRRLTGDILTAGTVFFLIPFTGYLLAELIHASGVLAAVAAGLIVSQMGPVYSSAPARRQFIAFWSLVTFMLNGALFILIGIEAHPAVRGFDGAALTRALLMVFAVAAVMTVTRIAFMFVSAYLIRAIDRRPQQRLLRVSDRSRIVSGLCGFRGAVSLAVALAVPHTLDSGAPFPDRDTIVFVAFGVIIVMLLPAFVLPSVVRWARFPADTRFDDELVLARTETTNAAIEALPRLADETGADPEAVRRLEAEMREHLEVIDASAGDDRTETARLHDDYNRLRLAVIAEKRATMIRMRNERRIDDTVLHRMQATLDIEEVRLREDVDED
ncbi:MAG TPA: Na+/H+ antiporter [Glycomyces sp.]|nr:Na+/H+ antiporter [Glycomyces sp.]